MTRRFAPYVGVVHERALGEHDLAAFLRVAARKLADGGGLPRAGGAGPPVPGVPGKVPRRCVTALPGPNGPETPYLSR